MSQSEPSFFERERDRLSVEITAGFEALLSSSNVLNRKLEEVHGMTREYDTIASLWQSFHDLMRGQRDDMLEDRTTVQGIPGTGAHTVSTNSNALQRIENI